MNQFLVCLCLCLCMIEEVLRGSPSGIDDYSFFYQYAGGHITHWKNSQTDELLRLFSFFWKKLELEVRQNIMVFQDWTAREQVELTNNQSNWGI